MKTRLFHQCCSTPGAFFFSWCTELFYKIQPVVYFTISKRKRFFLRCDGTLGKKFNSNNLVNALRFVPYIYSLYFVFVWNAFFQISKKKFPTFSSKFISWPAKKHGTSSCRIELRYRIGYFLSYTISFGICLT